MQTIAVNQQPDAVIHGMYAGQPDLDHPTKPAPDRGPKKPKPAPKPKKK